MTTGRVPAVEGKGAADDNAPAAIGREVFTDGSYEIGRASCRERV